MATPVAQASTATEATVSSVLGPLKQINAGPLNVGYVDADHMAKE